MVVSRDELAPASAFGAFFGAIADVVFTSGETMIAVLVFFVETVDLWLPFLSRLTEVAEGVAWLPVSPIETLVEIAVIVFVLMYAVRIARRWFERRRESNEN